MSLFEIEINDNFKILNREVFLKKDEFEKYYKLNNLNDGYRDDISEYLLDDVSLKVHPDYFCMYNYGFSSGYLIRYSIQEISTIITSDLYELNKNSNEEVFYPEWLLFLIAIKKRRIQFISEDNFRTYIKYFKFIAEIRYKTYIIRNIRNYINFNKMKNPNKFQKPLYNQLYQYAKNSQFEISEVYAFLNFLYSFHDELKEKEKYKLMWNLEVYIMEAVELLMRYDISVEEIYEKSIREGTSYAYLQTIRIYKPLYIRQHKTFFTPRLEKINGIFKESIDVDTLMDAFLANEKYEDILFYYIELIERLNSSKISEDIMGAIIKAIVLGVEEYVKMTVDKEFFNSLNIISSNKFESLKNIICPNRDENFFNCFKKIISKEDSLEKYLMIYYISRNYLAHNNIDMDKFFWGEDRKQTVISNVMDSVMMVLYKLATLESTN